jgi:hypothetical protein
MRPVSAIVPTPSSPTAADQSAGFRPTGFRFRNYSTSSSNDEDEDSVNSAEFVLPAAQNVIFGNGAVPGQGAFHFNKAGRKLNQQRQQNHHNHNKVQNNNHQLQMRRLDKLPNGGNEQDDYLDCEAAIFAALSKPISLEHRDKLEEKEQRKINKYLFKKEFPAVF